MDRQQHWDNIYATKAETDVSWFESEPLVSLELIKSVAPPGGRVIDVGGGVSRLVDRLLSNGFDSVTVLDLSATALEHAQARLGPRAAQVTWLVADVTQIAEIGQFDVWHDRAVFHFLTEPEDRRKYVDLATRSIRVGGHLILGTFALDGPPQCSGLNICRYDAATLSHELGPRFQLVKVLRHIHVTPAGATQPFFFGLFERRP